MSSIILKLTIPDIDVNKTIKVLRDETVWNVKLTMISKLQKVLPNGVINYGMYLPPQSATHPGGFLEDQRKVFDYNLPNNVSLLLKPKTREVPGKSDKDMAKYNTKKNQKAFMETILKKAFNKAKEMLDKGMDPNFVSETGETPLTYAALHDQAEMILLLVQTGGAFVDIRSADWKTPLHKAVMAGHIRALKSLLSVGASPDLCDKDNITPLYLAAVMGKPGCAEALLDAGSMLDTTDDSGRTELHQACLKDAPGVARLLIEFGAEVNIQNTAGNTPLHVAASANSVECAKILLAAGADKDVQNAAGDTPQQVAIMTTNFDIAETLGGAKPAMKVDRGSRQPQTKVELLNLPNAARILQVQEYIPPPPPPGYKGICRAPLDAPAR